MKNKLIFSIAGVVLTTMIIIVIICIITIAKPSNNNEPVPISSTSNYQYQIQTDETGMMIKETGIEFSGVTAITIYKDEEIIFSIRGVSGIGNNRYCPGISVFEDTPISYIEELESRFNEMKDDLNLEFITTEISKSEWLAVRFFDNDYRLTKKYLFNDINKETISFETDCSEFIIINGISYNVLIPQNPNASYRSQLYAVTVNADSKDDLEEIIKILKIIEQEIVDKGYLLKELTN